MDPYKVLGVARGASAEEIKRAYRELTRKWHPDRPGGSEARMKEINAAYKLMEDSNFKWGSYSRDGMRQEKTWTPPKTGNAKDPFGYNQYSYQWDVMKMWRDEMRRQQQRDFGADTFRYGFWDDAPKKKPKKPCPHCGGTGKVDA